MIEVKVQCACGQRFKFDVEPVNGLMPYEVKCPSCGADGTAQANAVIQEKLAAEGQTQAPSAGLRISRESASPAAEASSAPTAAPAPSSTKSTHAALMASHARNANNGGFLKGVAGALVASLVGMFAWYMLIKATGYEIGIVAWGVGGLTGLGARVVGAESSHKLGVVAGVLAFIAIIGGEFFAVKSVAEKEFEKLALIAYQEELDDANAALALSNDEEIKAFLAKHNAKNVADVTTEDLREFREKDLPRCRDLVAGKPSKAQFVARMNVVKNSFRVQFALLKESVSLFTLLWIFLGVGSAYKLGAGTHD
jgi:hypothetical protein